MKDLRAPIPVTGMLCGMAAMVMVMTGCSSSSAQPAVAAKACSASVTVLDSQKSCPTANITFRVSVSGCARSSGSFEYEFMAVKEGAKASVHRSASWIREVPEWEQTEAVPLACDQSIYQAGPKGTAQCTCTP